MPTAPAATPASSRPGSATATTRAMAVIELVDRDPDAKGKDSGPRPEAEEQAEEAA